MKGSCRPSRKLEVTLGCCENGPPLEPSHILSRKPAESMDNFSTSYIHTNTAKSQCGNGKVEPLGSIGSYKAPLPSDL